MADGKKSEAAKDPLYAAAEKAFAAPFGAIVELRAEDGDSLWVDGRQDPPQLLAAAPENGGPACCWRGPKETLQRALATARAFDSAFLSGRLAVAGDMSVMARLQLHEGR